VHGEADDRVERPVPVDLLADLQAGLLDDPTAARLRRRARAEPDVKAKLAALDRVRRDVSALGVDAASAPEVPAHVTATIGAALHTAPRPTRGRAPRRGLVAAVLVAAAVGAAAWLAGDHEHRTPAAPALSPAEVDGLLHRPAELGELTDSRSREACLRGLGYPASTPVLGAMPVRSGADDAVLMLLPDDAAARVKIVVVDHRCNAADPGLLAGGVVAVP
jgi:hypothetical protein